MPDGTFEATFDATAQRVNRGGDWVPVDASLRSNIDGTLSPAVAVNGLTLSGGGTGPLATVTNAGASVALSWPTSLPTPQLRGDTATYPGVLPDVDLQVTADTTGGVSELLVVKTADAAANPALRTLRLATTTTGVTLHGDATDNITAVTPSGEQAFHAAEPMMWDTPDETTTPNTSGPHFAADHAGAANGVPAGTGGSEDTGPGIDSTVTTVDATVTNGAITLVPDQQMLHDPDTTFPVYIDPSFIPTTRNPTGWTWAQQAFPTTSHWKDTSQGNPAVGYQGWTAGSYGKNRSLWQYDISSLTGSNVEIETGTLTTHETNSGPYSCSDSYKINVANMSHISSSTTWNNYPDYYSTQDSQQVLGASNDAGCPNRTNTFDVSGSLRSDGDGVVTYQLSADNESDKNYYKRFDGDSTVLSITYDRAPNIPTALTVVPTPLNPSGDCRTNIGWVGANPTVGFTAHISDPDMASTSQSVRADFHVWDKGGDGSLNPTVDIVALGDAEGESGWHSAKNPDGSTPSYWSAGQSIATSGNLTDGHMYGFDAWGDDGHMLSASGSDHCYFWYDSSAPSTTATSAVFKDDGTSTVHVGQSGTFTLKGTDVMRPGVSYSGIDHFRYSFASSAEIANDSGPAKDATRSTNTGTTTISFTPTVWGENYLYVAAVDAAGNQSATFTYPFYVPDNPDFTPKAGDITGDKIPDLLLTDKYNDTTTRTASGASTTGTLLITSADPSKASQLAMASLASDSPDANNDGKGWDGALIAHRGSNSGTGIDDLWAYKNGNPNGNPDAHLVFYKNAANDGTIAADQPYFPAAKESQVAFPSCRPTLTDCSTWDPASTGQWAGISQLVAPGDVDGDGHPDLIAVMNGTLWFLHGATTAGQVTDPRVITAPTDSSTGKPVVWSSWRLTGPGDSTGTETGTDWCAAGSTTPSSTGFAVPDLWAAPMSADLGPTLFQLKVAHHGCINSQSHQDIVTVGSPQTTGIGWAPVNRRLVASPGDINNDGVPDTYSIAQFASTDPQHRPQQLWLNTGNGLSTTGAPQNGHVVVDDGKHSVNWSLFTAIA